jgi:hypothetical protein
MSSAQDQAAGRPTLDSLPPLSTTTTQVTIPDKAALSSVTTAVTEDPCQSACPDSRRPSNATTVNDAKYRATLDTKGDAKVRVEQFELDVEAGEVSPQRPCASASSPYPGGDCSTPWQTHPCKPSRFHTKSIRLFWPNSDHRVWPGKDYWKEEAKAAKQKRARCAPLARLNRRNRIIAKVCIVLLIIGIGLAVGFGISRA